MPYGTKGEPIHTAITDSYGFAMECTPNDELRVVTPYRIIGSTFSGTTLDGNFWTSSGGTGGAVTIGNAQVVLNTGTTANNITYIQSVGSARYVGGSSNRFRIILQIPDNGYTNNTRRFGMFNANDGAFFELDGTTFSVVTRKDTVDTKVSNGSFNGQHGATYNLVRTVKTFEIYYNNSAVYFAQGGKVIHKVSADDNTWTSDVTLPIRIENFNHDGATSDVTLSIRNAVITKLGHVVTQKRSKYQSGTTAGVVAKYGAGNLSGLIVSNVTNGATVLIYDGLTSAGTLLFSTGAMGTQTTPFYLPFYDIAFFTGLCMAITGANCNATLCYE